MSDWVTPPEAQGQIVQVSYRWDDGCLLKRVYDASDRVETVYRLESEASDAIPESWHPVNEHPPIDDEGAWIEVRA